ncbi:MAG: AAA family ATPase [Candidatus Blackburnbacteria bacterium]|nr:AAA family ATPase [Candidatus Blackburnbacteria bacterium]
MATKLKIPRQLSGKSQNGNGGGNKKKGFQFRFQINLRNILLFLLILFFVGPLLLSFLGERAGETVPLPTVVSQIKQGQIENIHVVGDRLQVKYKNGDQKMAVKEGNVSFTEILKDSGIDPSTVPYNIDEQLLSRFWMDALGILLPVGVMALFFLFIFRQARGAQDNLFSFGKSGARAFAKGKQSVTFRDVAGVDEAKKELEEVVDFLKNPGKYRAIGARTPKGVLLFGPSGVGKCVRGDTLIATSKGLLEIQDIPKYFAVEESGFVHGATLSSFIPENANSLRVPASHWYDLGVSPTIKLETKMGHKIEGTPEHPLVVVNAEGRLSFRKLEEIKEGDWIPIKTGDQLFGNYRRLDREQCYILGLLIGDGGLTIKDRICFTTADKELLNSFTKYFKDNNSYQVKKATGKYDFVITSHAIKSQLIQAGLSESYSRNKKVPDYVMMSPKENIVAFLQGLFDTDGSVYKTGKVEFATSSEKLARQVSALLLNLGVMHKFINKGNNQFATSYRILISGLALSPFSQQVGFRLKRKQDKLLGYLAGIDLRTNVDLIPLQGKRIHKIWRRLVESQKKPSLVVAENFHKQICCYAQGGRNPNITSLRMFIEACEKVDFSILSDEEFNYLKSIANNGLFFDRVASLEKSESRVYDFTVPQTHSFISNGFISHNTLLARGVAGEAGVPFFSMAGSEFMEMLVGVGASRVRDLFLTAKKAAPSIIFIDEIDAIGRQRGYGIAGGHDEREQTLNQILVEMDGFTPNDSVLVIAATNRGDLLDPALLRPGRFDRRVTLDLPDREGREAILKIHARGKKFVDGINWERVAARTVGFSGADLENMLNEAAIAAARDNRKEVNTGDIEEAATKVKLGPAKRKLQSAEDRKITAYHEAGHALVAHILPHIDPVHRISIVARGMSLGHTYVPPEFDRTHETKTRLVECRGSQ